MALPFAPLGSSNRNRGTAAPRMPFAPPSSQNPASYKGAVAAGVRASFFADQVAVEDAADKTAIQAASLAQRQLESEQRTAERLAKTQADEAKKAAEAQQTREIAKAEYQRSTLPSTMTPEQRRSAEDKLAKKDRELRLRAASTLKEKLAGTGIASQTTGGFFSSEPTEEAKKAQQELERLSNPDLITDEDVAAYRKEKGGDFAEADALRQRLADDAAAAEQRRTATQNLARAKAIKAGVPEEELGAPPKPTAVGPSDPWKRVAVIGELDREGQALQQRSTQIVEQKASVSALDTQLQEAQADYQRGGTAAELLAKRESLLALQRQREQKAAELQSVVDEHNGSVSAYEAKIQAANESAAPKADTSVEPSAPTVPVQAAKSAAKANPDGSFETSQVDNLTSLSQAGERVYWSDPTSKATPETRTAKTKQANEAITVVQTLSEELTQGVQDAQQRIVDEVRAGRLSPESAQRAQDKAIAGYEAAHSEQVATRGQFLYDALRDFSEGQIDAGTLNALYHAAGSPSTGVEAFQEMQAQLAKDKEHVDALEKVILGEDGTGKDDPTLNGTALGLSAQIAEGSTKYQQWLDSGAYPKGMSEGEIAAQESNATAAMEGASKARKELQQIRDAQKQKLSAELTRLGVDVGQQPALIARAELQAMMKARPNVGAIVASKGGISAYAGEKLPFVGGFMEMARLLPYAETAMKLENGEQVAPDELQALTEFVRFSGENPGLMAKVSDGIASLPGFVMELAGTAGIVTAVKQGGNKVIGEVLQRVATKQGKTQLAAVMARSSADNVVAAWAKQNAKKAFVVKGLRGLAEEAVRLPVASASRIVAKYSRDTALDGVSLDIQDDKIATVIASDERSGPLRRVANAVVDSYIDNVSERTGFMLGKVPGGKWLSSKVSGLTAAAKQKLISAALFKSVLRANPGAAPGAIAKFLKSANIGNVPEEMFEERLGSAARDLWNGVSGQGWEFTMPSMEDLGAEFLTFLVPGGYAAIQTNRHFAKLDKAISASDAEVTSKLDGFAGEPQANAERLAAMVGHPITPQDIAAATDLVGPLHFSDAVRRSDRLQSEFLTKSEEALNAGDFDKASQYRQMALEHSRNKSRAADGELLRGIAASGEIEGIHAAAEALRTQAQSMTDPAQQGAAMQQAADMELIGDRISGIVKVATGRDASLTQNEKDALADPSMKPAVVYENGGSIITDEARDMLEQNAPAAWSYVKQSETMRREQLSASATTATATNPQPATTNENPNPGQKGLNPSTTAPATSQPVAGQWALTGDNGTVVTLPAGEAKTETEAETKLVAMLPKGENVRAGTLTRPKTQNTKPNAKPETKPETKPADYGKGDTFDSDKFAETGKAIPGGKKVKERVAKIMDVLADKLKVRGKSFTGGVSIDTSIRDGGGMKVDGDRLIVNPVLIASQTLDLDETRLADWVGRITSEEFIHLAQLQVLTPAEAAEKLQKLKKSKAGRALLADSLRAYNAAFEADGQTPPKLSDANHYFEMVRQIIQDKLDNNKITEAFFAEPGLKADLLEFLQKLSEWLQKRLAGLPKAERASIQDDIDKITAAIARMDQQATPNANTTTATTNPTTTPEDATKAATETTSESGNAKVGGDKVSSKAGTLTIVRLKGGRLASVRESELAGNGDTLREFDPATLKPVKGDKGAIARTDIDLQASATTPVAATSETLHKVPVTIRLRDGNIRTADFEQLATSPAEAEQRVRDSAVLRAYAAGGAQVTVGSEKSKVAEPVPAVPEVPATPEPITPAVEATTESLPADANVTSPNSPTIDNVDDLVKNGGGIIQVSQNGHKVDFKQFSIAIDGNTAEIGKVELSPSERGKGIGLAAYEQLGRELAARGITLQSSKAQYGDGRKVWRKLASKGLAKLGAQGVFSFTVPAVNKPAQAPTQGANPATLPPEQAAERRAQILAKENANAATPPDPAQVAAVLYDLRSAETGAALDLDEIELALDNAERRLQKGKPMDWPVDRTWLPNVSTASVPALKELLGSSEGIAAMRLRIDELKQDTSLKNMALYVGPDGMVRTRAFDFDGVPEDTSQEDVTAAKEVLAKTPLMPGIPLAEFSPAIQQRLSQHAAETPTNNSQAPAAKGEGEETAPEPAPSPANPEPSTKNEKPTPSALAEFVRNYLDPKTERRHAIDLAGQVTKLGLATSRADVQAVLDAVTAQMPVNDEGTPIHGTPQQKVWVELKDTLGYMARKGLDKAEAVPAPVGATTAKAETPAQAEAKVEEHLDNVVQTEGKRPAAEIKAELLATVGALLADTRKRSIERITDPGKPQKSYEEFAKDGLGDLVDNETFETREFQIPGDGTFKIALSGQNLSNLLKRIKALPVKDTGKIESISVGRGTAASAQAVAAKLYTAAAVRSWVVNAANGDPFAVKVIEAYRKSDNPEGINLAAIEAEVKALMAGVEWQGEETAPEPASDSILFSPPRPAAEQKAADAMRGNLEGLFAAKRAAGNRSVQPQDAEYLAAVERGDMAKAQAMVDEAAKKARLKKVWRKGSVTKPGEGGFHFGTQDQADSIEDSKAKSNAYYIKVSNPVRLVDYSDWSDPGLESQGYDLQENWPIVYLNRHEGLGEDGAVDLDGNPLLPTDQDALTDEEFLNANPSAKDSFIIRDPNQIKSADPVTYDDQGNVIPLSQRFDAGSDSILYAPARSSAKITHTFDDGYALTGAGLHEISAPVRAFHGTPHKVDKFSLNKIGTGEGAQAYGWGLYFAEQQQVAEGYQSRIAGAQWVDKAGRPRTAIEIGEAVYEQARKDGYSVKDADDLRSYWSAYAQNGGMQNTQGIESIRAVVDGQGIKLKRSGNLYTVELLPDEDEFLDWDRPLSEQKNPKLDALKKQHRAFLQDPAQRISDKGKNGDSLYHMVTRQKGSEKAASEYFASIGIPGIRYLDGGSRGAGDGTRNYVIFDENLVRILEENGTSVAVSAPARLGLQDPEFAAALDAINATLPDPSALDDLYRRSGIVTDSPTMEELAQGSQNMRWSGRAVYDEARDRQTHAEWSNQAASNIQADESGRLKNLVTKTATGQVLTAIETKEAQLLMPKLAMRAILSGDANALRDTGTVTWGYEIAGTAQARGLTARWQPHLTPEERHREYIAKAMFTPDRLTRERIASAPTEREKSERVGELEAEIEQVRADALARERDMLSQMSGIANKMAQGREAAIAKAKKDLQSLRSSTKTEIDKLRADLAKTKAEKDKAELLAEANKERIEQIREAFADMGVTLEQVLVTKEARLSIMGTNVVKGVFASFTEKERKAIRHRLDGFSNRQISKFNGISIAGLEAIFAKFDAALMNKFEAMAAQGITVEDFETVDAAGNRIDIDKLIDKDGNLMAPARPQLTPEEIKERALAMFRTIMPSEKARKSGALKRQKGGDKPTEAPYGFDLSRPEHAAMLVRAIGRLDSSGMDMVYEFWINGLLSGPTTQVANILGNIGSAALEYGIQRPLAAILNAILFRDAAGPSLGEYLSMVKYAGAALSTALRFAGIMWNTEISLFDSQWLNKPIVLSGTGGKGQVERFAIPGKTGKFIRVPTRLLGVADEFAKHLIGQLEAAAQAHRIAKAEGLTGDAFDKRVDTLVRVPGSAAWIAAVDQAHKLTFTEDLPEGMQKMQNWLHTRAQTLWGVVIKTLLRFAFPFVSTPYNIFKTAIRKTPIGSLRMIGKGLVAWKGGRPFFDSYPKAAIATDLAEQMLGWVAALVIFAIGEGDPDDDKKTWLLTGTRSMNDNLGEDQLLRRTRGGEMTLLYKGEPVFAWGRYEPFATVLATLIDAGREIKSMRGGVPPAEALKKATFDLIDQARSKTFLQGLDGLMGMLDERSGKNPMDSFVKFVTAGAVPNIIRQPLRNMDNFARDTRNAPWYYAAVPFGGLAEPLYDLYGRPVEKGGNSASRLLLESPLKKQPVQVADRAMRAYGDANPMDPKYLSNPTRAAFRFKDVFGNWQSMTPQQAADYRKAAGQQFAIEAAGVLPSPSAPSEEDMRQLGNLKERVFSAKKKEMFPGGFAPSPTPRRSPSLGELFGRVLRIEQ